MKRLQSTRDQTLDTCDGLPFRTIMDGSADAILIANREGQYQYANAAACELLGYESAELLQLGVRDLARPEDLEAHVTTFQSLQVGQGRLLEIVLRRKDGRDVHIELNTVALPSGHVYGSCRDVTPRKRAAEELEKLQAQLAQTDRLTALGVMAGGVAHEVNNPLAYLMFNLESLVEDLPAICAALKQAPQPNIDAEDVAERFDHALEGARRIGEVTRKLSAFSRVDKESLEPVNLVEAMESALRLAQNELRHRALLIKDYADVEPVLANPGRLSQVFLNLLLNAVHALKGTKSGDNEIHVQIFSTGSQICAEVRDTGRGIAAEHLEQLFEPFFTTKEKGEGSGLGLAISRSIVEGYRGHIHVESTLGHGSRFVVRLPRWVDPEREAEQQEARKGAAKPAEASTEHDLSPPSVELPSAEVARVLIVDDEPAIRKTLARMLRIHDTVLAADGEAAKQILSHDASFDAIVCDMMMPGLSGMELHCWLEEEHPQLAERVVFITGGAFTPEARAFLDSHGTPALEKPFRREALRSAVAEIMERGRSRSPSHPFEAMK